MLLDRLLSARIQLAGVKGLEQFRYHTTVHRAAGLLILSHVHQAFKVFHVIPELALVPVALQAIAP
jgi:hypothetical protein